MFNALRTIDDLIRLAGADNADEQLLTQVQQLRAELLALVDEHKVLKTRLAEIAAREEFARRLEYRSPFYFQPGSDHPLCRRCWEVDAKVAVLVLIGASRSQRTTIWTCRACDAEYRKVGRLR